MGKTTSQKRKEKLAPLLRDLNEKRKHRRLYVKSKSDWLLPSLDEAIATLEKDIKKIKGSKYGTKGRKDVDHIARKKWDYQSSVPPTLLQSSEVLKLASHIVFIAQQPLTALNDLCKQILPTHTKLIKELGCGRCDDCQQMLTELKRTPKFFTNTCLHGKVLRAVWTVRLQHYNEFLEIETKTNFIMDAKAAEELDDMTHAELTILMDQWGLRPKALPCNKMIHWLLHCQREQVQKAWEEHPRLQQKQRTARMFRDMMLELASEPFYHWRFLAVI